MRVSTDFQNPGYWHQGQIINDERETAVSLRTGIPVATVAAVMNDFFRHVYKTPEATTGDDGGITVLDQWGSGICVYPDGGFHHVGG